MAADLEKEIRAANEDEEFNQKAFSNLVAFSKKRLRIPVPSPADPNLKQEVRARIFEEPELIEYRERLSKINPELGKRRDPEEGPLILSPQEEKVFYELDREFVAKATGYSIQQVNQLSRPIVSRLIVTILRHSNPSREDVEAIEKFRSNQPGI